MGGRLKKDRGLIKKLNRTCQPLKQKKGKAMNDGDINKHPFVLHAQAIFDIANPFFEEFDITHFSNIRYYHSRHFTGLVSDAKWSELFLKKKHYNHDIYLRNVKTLQTGFNMWHKQFRNDLEEKIFTDIRAYGLGDGFTIIEHQKNYSEFFHFCSNKNKNIKLFFIQNRETLRFFIAYFKNKIAEHKELSQAMSKLYNIDTPINPEKCPLNPDYLGKTKRFLEAVSPMEALFINHEKKLTAREIECVQLHTQGYKTEELAQLLNIKPRTVYEHLKSIKEKMHCYSKFQLGAELAKISTKQSE